MPEDPYHEWLSFYAMFFDAPDQAGHFVQQCEDARPLRHPSRIIMHQCCRLVTLARDVVELRPAHHGLQVLFLLICAEATTKLHAGNTARDGSRSAVLSFFEDLLPEPAKQQLINGFRKQPDDVATLRYIANNLYDVRCDVAHEGDYWSVFFSRDGVPTTSRGWPLVATLSIESFTTIIVDGCIAAARDRL